MTEPLLEYDNTEISYHGHAVVHGVSARVAEGDVWGIVGESGSGKSTLVRAAMGLLGPQGGVTAGDIRFRGRSVVDMPQRELRRLCGSEMGMVFQDCAAALTPTRRVFPQLFEAVRVHDAHIAQRTVRTRAQDLLARMNIADPERVLASYPFELSGGIGQRVGIAIAMIMQPSILFADEPTSALDVVSQRLVVNELDALRRESGTAIVLVTHNIGVVRLLADRVAVIKDGAFVEAGETAEVMAHPQYAYTRELIAAVPHIGNAPAAEALDSYGEGDERA